MLRTSVGNTASIPILILYKKISIFSLHLFAIDDHHLILGQLGWQQYQVLEYRYQKSISKKIKQVIV